MKRNLILPSRRTRELIVSLSNKSKEEKLRTGEDFIKALKNPNHPSSLNIVTSRRLPSSDIAITFANSTSC